MAVVAVAAAATFTCGLASAVAHADEPAPDTIVPTTIVPDDSVPTGEFNGAEVAVDVPPVPPSSVEVAVDVPPVPPVTVPDAGAIVASAAVPAAPPSVRSDKQSHAKRSDVEPQLPETGVAAVRATAIVAGAAMSIGAALKALAQRG